MTVLRERSGQPKAINEMIRDIKINYDDLMLEAPFGEHPKNEPSLFICIKGESRWTIELQRPSMLTLIVSYDVKENKWYYKVPKREYEYEVDVDQVSSDLIRLLF